LAQNDNFGCFDSQTRHSKSFDFARRKWRTSVRAQDYLKSELLRYGCPWMDLPIVCTL